MLVVLTVGLGAAYALIVLVVFLFQRSLLYPAPHPGRAAGQPGTLWRLPAADAPDVVAFYLPPPQRRVLVWFHGNAEQIADLAPLARELWRGGLGVVLMEYPGYGLAPGAPTEATLYRAAEAVLRHLHGRLGVVPEDIVLLGQSLGSGVAVEMALRGHGARLLLLSPYTSIPALAAHHFPYLPARLLVRDRLDSLHKAPQVQVPALVIHGDADEVIPAAMGQALAARFPRSELLVLAGTHHNNIWDQDAVLARVRRFALEQ